jgi:hypothetical protein
MKDYWIVLSIQKYFDTNKGSFALYSFNEDESILDGFMANEPGWVELKISGPNIATPSAADDIREIWIHTMCVSKPNKDLTFATKLLQHFKDLFTTMIPVFKFGNETGDDGTAVGCLQLISNPVEVINWGKLNPSDSTSYQAIEAQYKLVA